MQILESDFKNLCFDDFHVKSVLFNKDIKMLIINIEGAYLINNETNILKDVKIDISNWTEFDASIYYEADKTTRTLGYSNFDTFKEINLSEIDQDVILSGFGKKTGQWITYKIINPKVNISVKKIERDDVCNNDV